MRRVVDQQRLCFAATVCPDGTPNLSPKGTIAVWGDDHLVFLHLYSPQTVANLEANPAIEVNVVDPIVRKGYRFKGTAEILTTGPVHDEVLRWFQRERGTDTSRVHAVVMIAVHAAAAVISPAYDSGVTEADVVRRWRDHHTGLANARLGLSGTVNPSGRPDDAVGNRQLLSGNGRRLDDGRLVGSFNLEEVLLGEPQPGRRVTLDMLTMHADDVFLHFHIRPGYSSEDARRLGMAETHLNVQLSDDCGTDYRIYSAGFMPVTEISQSSHAERAFAPGVPADARQLSVVLRSRPSDEVLGRLDLELLDHDVAVSR